MKQKTLLIALVLAVGVMLLPAVRAQNDQVQLSPQLQANQVRQDAIVNTPFSFYGKVVDENGQPVEGATAKVILSSEVGHPGISEYKILSGGDGMFSMKDLRAVSIEVAVTKDGYHTLENKHPAGGWGLDFQNRTFPSAADPAIFRLKKVGATEPLIVVHTGGIDVASDGTVSALDLAAGHKRKDVAGGVQVQTWIDAHDPKSLQPYHWKFEIAVPGGGLQLRTGEEQFVAPSSGYQESDVVDMAPGDHWTDVYTRKYFVKTADGKYGRIEVTVNTRGTFSVVGYLNPSGSQNLEFDPRKKIKHGAPQ